MRVTGRDWSRDLISCPGWAFQHQADPRLMSPILPWGAEGLCNSVCHENRLTGEVTPGVWQSLPAEQW